MKKTRIGPDAKKTIKMTVNRGPDQSFPFSLLPLSQKIVHDLAIRTIRTNLKISPPEYAVGFKPRNILRNISPSILRRDHINRVLNSFTQPIEGWQSSISRTAIVPP